MIRNLQLVLVLDLSKPFNTVSHEILFAKLEYYGFRGIVLDWMKSYFNNRNQFVQYNDHCSDLKNKLWGTSRIYLWPFVLFTIYINDIGNVSQIFELILFLWMIQVPFILITVNEMGW